MKKLNLIFSALFMTLTTMPMATFALTISGTVVDENNEPLIGATVVNPNTKQGIATDTDGKFSVTGTNISELKISYVGYKTETVKNLNDENLVVKLVVDNSVDEVIVLACDQPAFTQPLNAKKAETFYIRKQKKPVCIATECIGEPGEYKIQETYLNDEDRKNITCTEETYPAPDPTQKEETEESQRKKYLCMATCVKVKCSKQEKSAINASEAEYKDGECVPIKCKEKYHLNPETKKCEENKCPTAEEDWDGTKCVKARCSTAEIKALENATDGKWENGQCIPICNKNYHLNPETKKCEENKCPTAEEDWNGTECVQVRCTEEQKQALYAKDAKWDAVNNKCIATECAEDKNFKLENGKCNCQESYTLTNGACINEDILAEKQKAYDEAHEKEQSTENKLLGGLTTAATGIGGMQALQGMAEQSADEDAMADMAAYIETMRCTYGDGKQVKAGPEEIELPGANDQELMNLRGQYLALAQDLKERKEALGIKPGIESEVIIDRTQTGLYDDENIGITSGNYASLYRAQALKSEADQAKIDDAAKTSSNRVKYGAIAAGAGVVGGILGNELINGKLGDKLKEKNQGKALRAAVEIEKDALEDMKKCLKDAGVKDTDSLEFQNFYISVLSVKNINCKREITKIVNTTPSNIAAKTIFADSNDANVIYNQLIESFGPTIAGKMIGVTLSQPTTDTQKQNAINTLQSGIDKVTKRFQDAAKEDEKRLSSSGLKDFDIDFSSILSSFDGDGASSSIMDMVNNGFK